MACKSSQIKPDDFYGGDPRLNPNDHEKKHHRYFFHSHILRIVVLLWTIITVTCLVRYQTLYVSPFQFYSFNFFNHQPNNSANILGNIGELSLEQVLERAAMPNKTVILTTLNEAWIEPDSIFDLFLESFKIGDNTRWLLKHLVVVAVDRKAFNHCLKLNLNCFLLWIEGVDFSGETQYMTPDYLEMMWKRTDFLRQVVETGYNFIFTDADIMWFRNPFPHFHLDTNFQIACDKFNGNPWDLKNAPNGGFIYVKSSNQTIEFYRFWIKSREVDPRKNEQDVLNRIKFDPFVRKDIGVEIKFLDTANFGGFCQPSKDLNLVCTMHANCCIGLDNKIHDLKIMLEDWRKYMSLSENERRSQPTTWSVPQHCGPASFRRPYSPRKKNAINKRR